jgi:hypothetical protein
MDLSHINGRAIIEERDEESVRHLLELILELIIILKQEQGESPAEPDESLSNLHNVSDPVQRKNLRIPDQDESNNLDMEDIPVDQIEQLDENLNTVSLNEGEDHKLMKNNSEHLQHLEQSEPELDNINPVQEESYNLNLRENKSCPSIDIEAEGGDSNSQINYKENYSQNDLTRYEKVMAYLANNEELLAEQQEDMQNLNNYSDQMNNMNFYGHSEMEEDDSKPAVNISRISEVSRSKENSEPHSNNKIFKNNMTSNSKNYRNDSHSLTVKHTNSNNRGGATLGDSYGPSKISSVESKFNNDVLPTQEVNEDYDEEREDNEYMFDQNTESMDLDLKMSQSQKSSIAGQGKNMHIPSKQESKRGVQVSNNVQTNNYLPVKESSNNKQIQGQDKNLPMKKPSKKNSNPSQLSNPSNRTNRTNQTNKSAQSKVSKNSNSSLQAQGKKNFSKNKKVSNNNSNKNNASSNFSASGSKKYSSISNNYGEKIPLDKFESSNLQEEMEELDNIEHINQDPEDGRVLKKIKSQKQLIPTSAKERSNAHNAHNNQRQGHSQSDISMTSINITNRTHSQSKISQLNEADMQMDLSENIIEELPLNEENLKFEIMKEFRRIYGDKLDKIVLKNNMKNSGNNILEVILRNIKLAKQKMVKLGVTYADPDDLIVKNICF